jgi:hypothetical protein
MTIKIYGRSSSKDVPTAILPAGMSCLWWYRYKVCVKHASIPTISETVFGGKVKSLGIVKLVSFNT